VPLYCKVFVLLNVSYMDEHDNDDDDAVSKLNDDSGHSWMSD